MVDGEKVEAVGQDVLCAMGETVGGLAGDNAGLQQEGEVAVEGDLAEADDDADARQGLDLGCEMRSAVADLLRGGLVSGWGAADDGGNPSVAELEAVVAGDGAGLAGEAEIIEDGVHEVAGAVTGEDAASAVGSVSAGSQAEDEDAGARIAEAGDRAGPVGLVPIGTAFGFSDGSAVVSEARAKFARDDGVVNLLKKRRRSLYAWACHCIP